MTAHASGRHIGLGALLIGGGPEYAESLVASTLEFRGKASSAARNSLDRALDGCVRINGFRDASRAPSGPLKGPVLDALAEENAPFAQALLGVWAESKPELRDAVREYLGSDGAATGLPGANGRTWSARELKETVHALLGRNEELNEPDVGLMLCFVSGRCVHIDDPVVGIRSPLLLEFLEKLEGIDPNAPDWEDVSHFVDAVKELDVARVKRAADNAVAALAEQADKALRDYEGDLVYLDLHSQVSGWAEEACRNVWLIGEALVIVEELLQRLEEYSPIRPQAGTRAEETERVVARLAAEERILGVAERWRELMARPLDEDVEDPDAGWDDLPEGDPSEKSNGVLTAEVEELRAEVERLRRSGSERQVEHQGLARQRDDLVAERESLQSEIARLDAELASSRELVEAWKLAGVSARLDEAGLPDIARTEPRTVRDAVALAGKLFPDRLAIALNSKSDKRSQFQKPQEVFDALAWLATAYHHRRANPGGSPDFDKLLKESCPGWSYKSSQTEITREQFEEWYTTMWEGRRYVLNPHLGKGISYDPQNTIRIAFDWDDDRKRVVVGYIGMHQRNRKS